MTSTKKNRLIAGLVTILVHAVIVALLFVLCFRTPLPLPGEAGVEVNLGMYAGISQQDNVTTRQQVDETIRQQEEVTEKEEDIVSENIDIPAIEPEKKTVADEVKEEVIEEKKEEPVVNKRALFQVTQDNSVSSSEGNTETVGEQGSHNGLKDMDRFEGNGGSGGGPAYDLGGRGAKSIPSPSRDFDEEGKVVVDIWVDKEGKVQRAEIGKGTTVTNSSMRESARQAASKSIFVQDKNASDLQKGTITYTFIIRQ